MRARTFAGSRFRTAGWPEHPHVEECASDWRGRKVILKRRRRPQESRGFLRIGSREPASGGGVHCAAAPMSDPVLSDELLGGLVSRLDQLKIMSSDPKKVQLSIDEVKLTLRLRS